MWALVSVIFLPWSESTKRDWMVLPPSHWVAFTPRAWVFLIYPLCLWGEHGLSGAQPRTEMLLGPSCRGQARPVELKLCAGSPCIPASETAKALQHHTTIFWPGSRKRLPLQRAPPIVTVLISTPAALAHQGAVTITPTSLNLVVFVLLSHLYLFKRPGKANTCDALFILWLSLEHIKLIITSYKLEIGIFFCWQVLTVSNRHSATR